MLFFNEHFICCFCASYLIDDENDKHIDQQEIEEPAVDSRPHNDAAVSDSSPGGSTDVGDGEQLSESEDEIDENSLLERKLKEIRDKEAVTEEEERQKAAIKDLKRELKAQKERLVEERARAIYDQEKEHRQSKLQSDLKSLQKRLSQVREQQSEVLRSDSQQLEIKSEQFRYSDDHRLRDKSSGSSHALGPRSPMGNSSSSRFNLSRGGETQVMMTNSSQIGSGLDFNRDVSRNNTDRRDLYGQPGTSGSHVNDVVMGDFDEGGRHNVGLSPVKSPGAHKRKQAVIQPSSEIRSFSANILNDMVQNRRKKQRKQGYISPVGSPTAVTSMVEISLVKETAMKKGDIFIASKLTQKNIDSFQANLKVLHVDAVGQYPVVEDSYYKIMASFVPCLSGESGERKVVLLREMLVNFITVNYCKFVKVHLLLYNCLMQAF